MIKPARSLSSCSLYTFNETWVGKYENVKNNSFLPSSTSSLLLPPSLTYQKLVHPPDQNGPPHLLALDHFEPRRK